MQTCSIINPRQDLVIVKGKDQTSNIVGIEERGDRTLVTYKNGNTYLYDRRNVEWLVSPVPLSHKKQRVVIAGDLISDVVEVLRFAKWVKIFQRSGAARCCLYVELSLLPNQTKDGRSTDVLAYFRELAEGSTLKTDENDSLLSLKFRNLSAVSSASILSSFLQSNIHEPEFLSGQEQIFPFSCNMSQKKAVERALQSRISLIQGPPGTGKTQTILNLIGNMLLLDKRVAVVSNNNSATANVLEKLNKNGIGFVAASLGSTQNKREFIEEQTGAAVQIPKLNDTQISTLFDEILFVNQEVDGAFATKDELAALIQQIDSLQLELSHFEMFLQEKNAAGHAYECDWSCLTKKSAQKLMSAWVCYEQKVKKRGATLSRSSALFRYDHGWLRRVLEKISLFLRFGLAGRALFPLALEDRIPLLQKAYFLRKLADLRSRKKELEASLAVFNFDSRLQRLTRLSMQALQHHLAARYSNRARRVFTIEDLWQQPDEFLKEYPVILSTTFSLNTSLKKGFLFDYVIVDEASQVDLLNGVLAMACAKALVVVGDPMQLPNVLTDQDRNQAAQVGLRYELPDHVKFERHNLLSAVRAAFPRIPETLLREHYRCHPKIIQFCNHKFYGGKLLIMTRDRGESEVLKAIVTVEGHHARGVFNQRQIDEVVENVLPDLSSINQADIGIVSPYREQAVKLQTTLGAKEVEIDTVHKYQGREKRAVIITTVANETNQFVDNPNLLNVAVSRAQEKLRLVVSKEMAEGNGNVADLVRYIRYSNCEVVSGQVRSIFDLLYSDYTAARLKIMRKQKKISSYDSENLAFGEIETVLREEAFSGHGVVFQFPLATLVLDTAGLNAEESIYVANPWTHIDFLIYRKVDKMPVLAIEIDGYAFHREGTRQSRRDILKDSILRKCGLATLRLSTIGSNERSRIREAMAAVI